MSQAIYLPRCRLAISSRPTRSDMGVTMQQQPRLMIPALGPLYRAVAPLTEPLIRVVAGGSLAIHGYPILFGNKAAAAKFLESVGFEDGLFWATIVGTVEFVCGLCLALGLLTRFPGARRRAVVARRADRPGIVMP